MGWEKSEEPTKRLCEGRRKRVITRLEDRLSPEDMLDVHEEPEAPFQVLIDSI